MAERKLVIGRVFPFLTITNEVWNEKGIELPRFGYSYNAIVEQEHVAS